MPFSLFSISIKNETYATSLILLKNANQVCADKEKRNKWVCGN